MRITSLKVFVDLVESKSFSEAASRNGITQPAVSQQIGCLEDAFATSLVERSRRRFRLTPAGEELFNTAREVIKSMEDVKSRICELGNQVKGALQVVTTANLAIEWLPRLQASLRSAYPDIALQAVYQPSSRIYADVAGNVADFGIIACPKNDPRFDTILITEESFCFVGTPISSLQDRKLDGTTRPFVSYTPDLPTAQLIATALAHMEVKPSTTLEFEQPETVKKALYATGGFSCLPENSVAEELKSGALIKLPIKGDAPVRKIGVILHKHRNHSSILQALQTHIEQSYALSSPEGISAPMPQRRGQRKTASENLASA